MTNSKKIMWIVAGICSFSLLATLNLIRKDEAKRATESQADGTTQGISDTKAQAERGTIAAGDVNRSSDEKTTSVATLEQSTLGREEDLSQAKSGDGEQIHETKPEAMQSIGVSPSGMSAGSAVSSRTDGTSVVAADSAAVSAKNKNIVFPGIEQKQDRVMVRAVRYKTGDSDDQITVTLTVNDDGGEVDGRVWIIGEYFQRGTTGVMFMPSHDDLNLTADGKPQNPNSGITFSMRFNTEKKFVIKRPGFEGEELTAIKVGVWDKKTGKLHVARMPIKQAAKKSSTQRAKVELE